MIFHLLACSSPPALTEPVPVVLETGVPWSVPARLPWEDGAWPRAEPEEAGLDPSALKKLGDYAFRRDGDEVDRRGQRTDALLIVRGSKIVYERYARETTAQTPLLTWSVTKSFGGTLYGAAVHEGLIDLNDPVCTHVPSMCRPGHETVRITDLLQMSSGLEWHETYETSPIFSSVLAMLYTNGSGDMAEYVAGRPLTARPGTRWVYSSGDSNLAMAALKKPLGDRYASYPWTALIEPLGMSTAVLEPDASGTHIASSYLYASAPDLARWGQLMLDDGVWQGRRLLAPGWVRYSSTIAPAFYTTEVGREHHESNPGAQWYVNLGDPERGLERPWPALPEDAFGASGHWGKYIWVIPSWDMVVVRMGDDREYGCSYDTQPKCVDDVEAAFTKVHFLQLLADTVQ